MEQVQRPISLYNSDKKELVGVFFTQKLALKYIYGYKWASRSCYLWGAIAKKMVIRKNVLLGFPIAVRYANNEQIELLGDLDYIILNVYSDMFNVPIQNFKDDDEKSLSTIMKVRNQHINT